MVMRKKDVAIDFEPGDDREIFFFKELGHFKQRVNNFADLYVNIKVKEHPIFRFERPHIHSDYYLTVSEAILGKKLEIYTIFGKKEVEVLPGTAHGSKVTVKGFGAKVPEQGDHILHLKIDVGKRLNPSQESMLKSFYKSYLERKSS